MDEILRVKKLIRNYEKPSRDGTKEEIKVLNDSFNSVASACDLFIKNNFNKAMNDYNSRKNA